MGSKQTIVLVALFLTSCFAEIFIDPVITQLDKSNFYNLTGLSTPKQNQTLIATTNWFIIFYSPYCPHCQVTMPSWNEFAKELITKPAEQPTKIGSVDCPAHGDLCNEFDVHGYPTMIFLSMNNTKNEYKGERKVQNYRGFLTQIYTGVTKTIPVDQKHPDGVVEQIHQFFSNLTWVGLLMMILMVILVIMLIYVLFDKQQVGKQFTQVRYDQGSKDLTQL